MERRDKNGLTEEDFLAQYKPGDYERPSVTVDMLVISVSEDKKHLRTLLIKRGGHPYLGEWALPGGFVNPNETAFQAAKRELLEETGLDDIYLSQIYTFSNPDRDPRTRVISIAFLALIQERDVKAGDDAKEALWFDTTFAEKKITFTNRKAGVTIQYSLTPQVFQNGAIKYKNYIPKKETETGLAFDHIEIILEGMKTLRRMVAQTDIIFNLLDQKFTLKDLNMLLELITGKRMYYQKMMAVFGEKIFLIGKAQSSDRGRKADLYMYQPKEEDFL